MKDSLQLLPLGLEPDEATCAEGNMRYHYDEQLTLTFHMGALKPMTVHIDMSQPKTKQRGKQILPRTAVQGVETSVVNVTWPACFLFYNVLQIQLLTGFINYLHNRLHTCLVHQHTTHRDPRSHLLLVLQGHNRCTCLKHRSWQPVTTTW